MTAQISATVMALAIVKFVIMLLPSVMRTVCLPSRGGDRGAPGGVPLMSGRSVSRSLSVDHDCHAHRPPASRVSALVATSFRRLRPAELRDHHPEQPG